MKQLLILRHAAAASASTGVPDRHRPLTGAGSAQATALGGLLHQWRLLPGRIVASAALRAVETAEALVGGAAGDVAVERSERLYNASAEELLTFGQGLPDGEERVMVVAHAPGVAHLVSLLITEHMDLFMSFPAGTLAQVDLDSDRWSDLDYGAGMLRLFLPPVAPPRSRG